MTDAAPDLKIWAPKEEEDSHEKLFNDLFELFKKNHDLASYDDPEVEEWFIRFIDKEKAEEREKTQR